MCILYCVSTDTDVEHVRTYLRYEEDDLHGMDFFGVRGQASCQLNGCDAGAPDVSTPVIR